MMKWCFSTLGCTDRSLGEILALAHRYGIAAVEVRGIGGVLDNGEIADFAPENAPKTKEMLQGAGVMPLILGTSVSFHDKEKFAENLQAGKRDIEIAARLGFSAVRVFGNRIVGDEAECIGRVAEGVRALSLVAAPLGVSVLLEVHGDFNTVPRLISIIERCDGCENFGLIWDICHTHAIYGADWRRFYDALAPFIRHVHLKDIKKGLHVLPGEGELPICEVIRTMQADGYEGCFSLEWEKHWHKELPEIEVALERLLQLPI
ncbi:MAG: sugar phosphate isomerase/epimerase [Ruminococcaceae bacterium]|nr:sugar phosphate isomerase/epimerase [Oscillospiraceae bacterium]